MKSSSRKTASAASTSKEAASKKVAAQKRAGKTAAAKRAVTTKKATAGKSATSAATPKKGAQKKTATSPVDAKKQAERKAAARSAPAKQKTMSGHAAEAKLGKRFLAGVQSRLDEEKARLLAQLEELAKERQILTEDREDRDDTFTEESGEGASTLAEQEREESLAIRIRELLEKVQRAMAKIPKGTYGLCERCGKPIERARLEALPYAELCIECKRKEERRF